MLGVLFKTYFVFSKFPDYSIFEIISVFRNVTRFPEASPLSLQNVIEDTQTYY